MRFTDRTSAGRLLAHRLLHLRGEGVVVLGLPRGGVPVAAEVARALNCPLDVIVVRKLGLPWQRELAYGAIGEDGTRVVNDAVIRESGLTAVEMQRVEAREETELDRRVWGYRSGHPRVPLQGKTAVIVDDGIATGATARAACAVARGMGARHVVIAVPVAPSGWEESFVGNADEQMSLFAPVDFGSVGYFYDHFEPISDDEVVAILAASQQSTIEEDTHVVMGDHGFDVHTVIPARSWATLLFLHGAGSSRKSPRNVALAQQVARSGVASVLIDVVYEAPDGTTLDMEALMGRLISVTRWMGSDSRFGGNAVVVIGSSSGAALAVSLALRLSDDVAAVITRGGNLSAVGDVAASLRVPVLMIVGSRDVPTLVANRSLCEAIGATCTMAIVEGAGHLFDEGNTLEEVGRLVVGFIERVLDA